MADGAEIVCREFFGDAAEVERLPADLAHDFCCQRTSRRRAAGGISPA